MDKIAAMGGIRPSFVPFAVLAAVVLATLAALSACGTVNRLRGPEEGASSEKDARDMAPDDPLARPTQVAWTSARASYCGFIFSPEQLRTNFLNAEALAGHSEAQMQEITKAYDYTRDSVLESIKDKPGYCNKARTDAIRGDLNRYLAGDYSARARMAR